MPPVNQKNNKLPSSDIDSQRGRKLKNNKGRKAGVNMTKSLDISDNSKKLLPPLDLGTPKGDNILPPNINVLAPPIAAY